MNTEVVSLLNHGYSKHQQGALALAEQCYRQVLSQQPHQFDALYLLGILKMQMGDMAAAAGFLTQATILQPRHVDALLQLGAALAQQGQSEAALDHFKKAQKLDFMNPKVFFNIGLASVALGRYEAAIEAFKQAIALAPDYIEAIVNLGNAYYELEDYAAAAACFEKTLKLVPNYPKALFGQGAAFCKLERYEEASLATDRLLQMVPNAYEAHDNRGQILAAQKKFEEAIAEYQIALQLNSNAARVYSNLGLVLVALKQFDQAFAAYEKAIQINPNDADVHNNLGLAFEAQKQYDNALAAYGRCLELEPTNADAWGNIALILSDRAQYPEATAAFVKAIQLRPAARWLLGHLNRTRMQACDWTAFDESAASILSRITDGDKVIEPLGLLCISSSLEQQKRCAEIYTTCINPEVPSQPAYLYKHDRIRLGYVSCDFKEHAVSYLISGLIEAHDRRRFEVVGINIGEESSVPAQKRLKEAFDAFHQVDQLPDTQIADLVRSLEIDVLIDLTGYTKGARTGAFGYRPAPVQVNYLGFPGTMGASYIDYIIGDAVLIPPAMRYGYSEKIVYMPECFQANDSRREIAPPKPRSHFGLEDHAFVFACFNQSMKFNPAVFTVWLSILKQVPNSVLWLVEAHKLQAENLRNFAAQHGVSPDRLVFAGNLPYAEHLGRYALADLVLDTAPFSGGTTTSDALWGGAPVLTCVGETFAGRMTASLLNAINMPELITDSLEAYEALAVELALNPARLGALRQKLAANRLTAPLFNTERFTRHLENAYEQMVVRYQQGLKPDHIYVTPN